MSLDPEDDTAPGDTTSENASNSKFQGAWQKFSSKPENSAALLQFGIAMLQPRAPGQSGIGQAANALAEGGGAAGRVIATQKADDVQTAAEEDKAAQRANQATTAESGRITANAYARGVDANPGGIRGALSASLRAQQGFRQWLVKPEDLTGLQADPVLGAVQKQFPDVKTKADLVSNPAARALAFRLYSQVNPDAVDEGGGTPEVPAAPAASPSSSPRTIYDKAGKAYTWDGVPGHQPVPQ